MMLPEYVEDAINRLEGCGFEAYVVGGAVRDLILGLKPHDFDLCTSASPEEVMSCFKDSTVLPTGIKHGTVTVLSEKPLEITTFRTEGSYGDRRHPDSIEFVSDLREDLSRRDFTVNAMAYCKRTGFVDPFGGAADAKAHIIRCVGEPDRRFSEDGLRIIRALRFASVYGFGIEEKTAESIHKNKELLNMISAERIYSEMTKLLCGTGAAAVMDSFTDVIAVIIPEILPSVGFNQHTRHHNLDVWHHTLAVIGYSEITPVMRWTALLHDLGKPGCFTTDSEGHGHFKGHPAAGARIASGVLLRLRCDNATKNAICTLVANHENYFNGNEPEIRRVIGALGADTVSAVIAFRVYDIKAQAPDTVDGKLARNKVVRGMFDEIIAKGLPCAVSSLAVNGADLKKAGVPEGRRIGFILEELIGLVIDGKCPNTEEELLAFAKIINTRF